MKKLLLLTCLFMLFGGSKTYADNLSRRIFIELQGGLATSWSWKNQAPVVWIGSSANKVTTTLKKDVYKRTDNYGTRDNKLYYADITGENLSDLKLIITSGEGSDDKYHAVTVEHVNLSTTNKIFYIYVSNNECKVSAVDYSYKFVHWASGGENTALTNSGNQTELTYSGNNLVGTYNNTGEQFGVVYPTLVLDNGPFKDFYSEFAHRPANLGSDFLINNFIVYSDALTGNDKTFKFTEDMYYDLSFTISESSTFTVTPYRTATIGTALYATWSNGDKYTVSGAEKIYTVGANNTNSVTLTEQPASTVFPANGGILVKGNENDVVKFYAVASTTAASTIGTNYLVGSGNDDLPITVGTDDKKYVFSWDGSNPSTVGFYKAEGNGTLGAHKAYLDLSEAPGKAGEFLSFNFDEEETDGIGKVANANFDANAQVYNLAGQKVGANYKGIVIVNGKKVVRK